MKLYYSPGACSLAPHIVAEEAGVPVDLVKVDIVKTHKTESGGDYYKINPRGYVPAIELDDGSVHTEASVLVRFLADQRPESGLIAPAGSMARLETEEWLNFIATELHKSFSPWLWHKETAPDTVKVAKNKVFAVFAELERRLDGRDYLMGERFSVVDAYAFTITNWANFLHIDLKPYPRLSAYMARVAARPKVHQVLRAEGLVKHAA